MTKNIVSYNVNGIRAALRKGLAEWLSEIEVDILCLQETKALKEQVDIESLKEQGFHDYWYSAEKKGYSGVAIFSKQEPNQVIYGCGIEAYDREGRIIRADWGDLTLLNCYFPSGTSGEERQAFKMEFLKDFQDWVNTLKKERPNLIVVGDYNIAHTEIDIHDPVRNKKNSGFLPEERAWMSQWLESGFKDAFRYSHHEKVEYSWWTYRANARANNKGWRIDYQSVATPIADQIVDAGHYSDAVHSDHCPVWLKIKT